jgi:hypothetical protein
VTAGTGTALTLDTIAAAQGDTVAVSTSCQGPYFFTEWSVTGGTATVLTPSQPSTRVIVTTSASITGACQLPTALRAQVAPLPGDVRFERVGGSTRVILNRDRKEAVLRLYSPRGALIGIVSAGAENGNVFDVESNSLPQGMVIGEVLGCDGRRLRFIIPR